MPRAPDLSHSRYAPGSILGRGAQGVVLRVVDREGPERALVAKVWRPGSFDETALTGEFALLARLRIPGLVRAHDLARDERTGAPFLVEDFVGGEEAAAWVIAASGTDRLQRMTRVLAGVAQTLAALHDAGLSHGDLKPEHVRLAEDPRTREPRTVLLDLGAAAMRARVDATSRGFTRAFAAPEIVAGAPSSPASDLFGLGALAWAIATGAAPPSGPRAPLRTLAPWVTPTVADIVLALLEVHPRDRPASAADVLARLGAATRAHGIALGAPALPIGRERELEALASKGASVRYIIGPSGAGKSHLAHELVTRRLLAGESARIVTFGTETGAIAARLVAFLRGSAFALPFALPSKGARLLLVLDDLDRAPVELVAALDAYRCHRDESRRVEIVATSREAPDGADVVPLGPLDETSFASLCTAIGIHDAAEVRAAALASGRSPGWLVSSSGRVPLTRDAALARAASLSPDAAKVVTALALVGGAGSEALCSRVLETSSAKATAELLSVALITRSASGYILSTLALAKDLAAALASPDLVDRVAGALLADDDASALALLAIVDAPTAPQRRAEILQRAAARARNDGLRSEEIDALLALAADPALRAPALLLRLERLIRDAGAGVTHPEVLEWLDRAAQDDARVLPLALRRRAEKLAREGDVAGARTLADEARAAARQSGELEAEAFSLATLGLVALYRAEWPAAEKALVEARAMLAGLEVSDAEEAARLDHNLGVVALYRGHVADAVAAFERSLEVKRRLGDRAGMRSCLLNLGLALAKMGRLDEADVALDEALALARSLRQSAGRGWCLAARADVEVRRSRPRQAERWIAEAATLRADLPAAVRADLVILRAEVALLDGRGAQALAAIGDLDSTVRDADPMIDARARIAESSAYLSTLPANPRRAARLAVSAVRRARAAELGEVEAQAILALRRARSSALRAAAPRAYARTMSPDAREDPLWRWLHALAADAGGRESAADLARLLVGVAGAERAIVAAVDAAGTVTKAWGVDLDGLALADAERRIDADLVRAAIAHAEPVYQRDIASAAGRGARLAFAAPGAVVIVEHRFAPGRFDAVGAVDIARWATLAAIAVRASVARAIVNESSADAAIEHLTTSDDATAPETTVLPSKEPRRTFPTIVGESAALRRALAKLDLAIDSELPALIIGETGVGKELFARALHEHGPRAGRAFVALNCGAVPESLFEAELFGHARGSFTGADRTRLGLIAEAEGGTLLLDEIAELPLSRQAVLLRVLESRRYRPVGSDQERAFDVRIVAATNRDLESEVRAKTFRQDLLFRLNALEIRVPPLRDRASDVPLLARTFLARAGASSVIAKDAIAAIAAYSWPGNARELEHHMQRIAALRLPRVELEHLPRSLRKSSGAARVAAIEPRPARAREASDERAEILAALEETGGNISRAALRLGITRHGLKKRMVRLGMRAPASAEEGPR